VHIKEVLILSFPYNNCVGICGSGKGFPPSTTIDIIRQFLLTLLHKERQTKPENLQNYVLLKYKRIGY
jgi:hypothetical protein